MRRIGIIGLDTSHAPELARYFNNGAGAPAGRVTTAWAGGAPNVPLSIDRIAGFTSDVRDGCGVKILAEPEEVAAQSDAILLLALDGRTHADLFERVAAVGRPVFVNKPLATSTADAAKIAALAEKHGVRWFSASAMRLAMTANRAARRVEVSCPLWFEPANAGWFWYGVHGVEMLSAIMGAGIAAVRVEVHPDREVLAARWHDGRSARITGVLSRDAGFSFSCDGESPWTVPAEMLPLSAAIASFFGGAPAPVALDEMIEVVRCLEAANESRARGGAEIELGT